MPGAFEREAQELHFEILLERLDDLQYPGAVAIVQILFFRWRYDADVVYSWPWTGRHLRSRDPDPQRHGQCC